jgi:uncharacterized membrane protein required for colicin V production
MVQDSTPGANAHGANPKEGTGPRSGLAFRGVRGTIRGMETSWLSQVNLVDLFAVAYLFYGMIRGFMRGLSGELARVISMVAVFLLGWHFYEVVGQKVMEGTRLGEQAAQLTGFLLILVGAGIGTVLIRWILRNLMEFKFKEPLERVGGGVGGLVRSGAWVALIIIAATLSPSEYLNRKFSAESRLGALVSQHLIPAYQRLAEERPELGLPVIQDGERPATLEEKAENEDRAEEAEEPVTRGDEE